MTDKTAKKQDLESNKAKVETDSKAADLIGVDLDTAKFDAGRIASRIKNHWPDNSHLVRIAVCGAAGSGKTTIAGVLSKEMSLKNLDFDEYIPMGYTEDKDEYARRLNKGMYEMWEDVPAKKGWIIEHVEACNKALVGLYRPNVVILVCPGLERLRLAAEARAAVSESGTENRLARALQSEKQSRTQFNALPGNILLELPGYIVKELPEG